MKKQTNRIVKRIETLGKISDDANCLSRFYGTKAHKKAGKKIVKWMKKAGMQTSKDIVGNINGVLKSNNPNAKHFMIGSHYDSVFNAGKYDGPLGVILGIEIAHHFSKQEIDLPFHLHVAAFADEEGCRFNIAYLGSSLIAGNFNKNWLTKVDDFGFSLGDLIKKDKGNINEINKNVIPSKDWLGYFEAHIEQGPVLCEENIPVCLVDSIAAQNRINITWKGISGHAGTYPMGLRNDALCSASEFVLAIEEIGNTHKGKLVATVGKLKPKPNISNVIPGLVTHSLDIRSSDNAFLEKITKQLYDNASEIAKRRNIKVQWDMMQSNPSVLCDEDLKNSLRKVIKKHNHKLIEIPSGAGHDGVMISKVAPVSMLFIRCKDGISHNPLEYVSPEDIEESFKVSYDFVNELAKKYKYE